MTTWKGTSRKALVIQIGPRSLSLVCLFDACGIAFNAAIGNKLDLAAQPGKRVISYEQGKALADKEGIPFFEVSAKTGENVDKFFEAVARKLAGAPEAYALSFLLLLLIY